MKKINIAPKFEKDLKKVREYKGFKKEKLATLTNMIAAGEKLPVSAQDHKMSSTSPEHYQGTRNFHVAPDICVIYRVDDSFVYLLRIGKHNNLNLTESENIV